jgi:hypothetical protein
MHVRAVMHVGREVEPAPMLNLYAERLQIRWNSQYSGDPAARLCSC